MSLPLSLLRRNREEEVIERLIAHYKKAEANCGRQEEDGSCTHREVKGKGDLGE